MTKITETFNTRYNLCRATRARALSLPHSPRSQPSAEALDNTPLPKLTPVGGHYATPIEKPAVDELPGLRTSSPVYPGAFDAPEATIAVPTVRVEMLTHSANVDLLNKVQNDSSSPLSASGNENDSYDPQLWTVEHEKPHERRTTGGQLRPDRERIVREAERRLTPDEREKIWRRTLFKNVYDHESAVSDRGRHPVASKGKGLYPRKTCGPRILEVGTGLVQGR